MYGNLIQFFQAIGADKQLPGERTARISWLNHFHIQVAVYNPLWPEDMSFGFVYGAFVNAIMYNRVELKGHNIHAFITAFKNWILQSGVEDNLRRTWLQSNPGKAPKQLEQRAGETEHTKQIQAEGYVDFSPAVVKQQVETLEKMYGPAKEVIKAFSRKENQIERLYNTYEKYKQEGKL